MRTGNIFNIQRFSIHDGPGIRTTIFFKGCALRCEWCHNPESFEPGISIRYLAEKCIMCGNCARICPNGAQICENGLRYWDRNSCKNALRCSEVCNAGALVTVGHYTSKAELLDEIVRDMPYYRISDGGVTASGGEPMLQSGFLGELFAGCEAAGIHTAVDTAGYAPWSAFEEILDKTDLFLYDIKCVDNEKHIHATGKGNGMILSNLEKLSRSGKEIWIRVPVIPDFNASVIEMRGIAEFAASLHSVSRVDLLAFHRLGREKYEEIGLKYKCGSYSEVSAETMESYVGIFRQAGLEVNICI